MTFSDPSTNVPSPPPIALNGDVLLIGDVHHEDVALRTALRWADEHHIKHKLCVGDLTDGKGDFQRCCQLLRDHGVYTVTGNHDRWALNNQYRDHFRAVAPSTFEAERAFVSTLPPTMTFSTPRGPLLLCHGIGEDDMIRLTPDSYGYDLEANDALQAILKEGKYRVVVGGHTHRRMMRTIGGVVFINAGTLRHDHEPCFAVLNVDELTVSFWDVGAV